MIPPYLEKLVWENEATIRTWTIGTPSASLEVPRGKTIVIFNMLYYPFIDADSDEINGPIVDWLERVNKQITISTKVKRINYLMRAFFQAAGPVVGAASGSGIGADNVSQDMYFVAQDDINVAISNLPQPATWTPVMSVAPKDSDIAHPPLTYGEFAQAGAIAVPTLIDFTVGAIPAEVRPFFKTRAAPTAGISQSYGQFESPVLPTTGLNFPSTAIFNVGTLQFPLITFTYALLNMTTKGDIG